jgi:hypothetical protein
MNAFDTGCRRWIERTYTLLSQITGNHQCPEDTRNEALRLMVMAEGLSGRTGQLWWPDLSPDRWTRKC